MGEPAARRRCSTCGQLVTPGRSYRQEAASSGACAACGAAKVREAQADSARDDEDSGAHPVPGTADSSGGRYG